MRTVTQNTRFINKRLNSTAERERPGMFRDAVQLAYALEGGAFIAGGMARAFVAGSDAPEPSDIDVFCVSVEAFAKVVNVVESLGYRCVGAQGSAEGYEAPGKLPVQIVPPVGVHNSQRRFGAPWDVIADFTFITEQFAVYSDGAENPLRAIYSRDALTDTKLKRIRLNKVASPLYATWRIAKYARKGYRISIREVQKLFREWEAVEPERKASILDADTPNPGDLYREIGKL